MSADPFATLGLDAAAATAADVRSARRELARTLHPDIGGDAAAMQVVNAAAAEALRQIARPPDPVDPEASTVETVEAADEWVGTTRDVPSFTIEALPVEAYEALLVATAELGEVEDDDPPYVLRTLLSEPIACWCQLDLVPDAGASTVSVSIAAVEGHRLPALVDVRNAWIGALNGLDWSAL